MQAFLLALCFHVNKTPEQVSFQTCSGVSYRKLFTLTTIYSSFGHILASYSSHVQTFSSLPIIHTPFGHISASYSSHVQTFSLSPVFSSLFGHTLASYLLHVQIPSLSPISLSTFGHLLAFSPLHVQKFKFYRFSFVFPGFTTSITYKIRIRISTAPTIFRICCAYSSVPPIVTR